MYYPLPSAAGSREVCMYVVYYVFYKYCARCAVYIILQYII